MLTLLQCRKLGQVYKCIYYSELEEGIKLRGKRVVQVRVKEWHPFQSDIFNDDGTLDHKELNRVHLKTAIASVLLEEEYFEEDEYDEETDDLIKEGKLITNKDRIMQLDDNRYQGDKGWYPLTDEEIEDLYTQASWEKKE